MANKKLKTTLKEAPITAEFDEFCNIIKNSIINPQTSPFEYYVGLEHIESESLKIKNFGSPLDVKSNKYVFQSGQILFGRRRAYQRKLAIADVDGICSTDIFVLEHKPGKILRNYLPLFMQTEIFYERVLQHSDGSLSPRIKWKNLAKEKFSIPSQKTQKQIVEIISKIDESLEKSEFLIERLENLLLSTLNHFLNRYCDSSNKHVKLPKNWKLLAISDVVNKNQNLKYKKLKSNSYKDVGKFPIIDQGQKFVSGYTDDEKNLYTGKLPVIVFGDHTLVLKYVDFPFAAGADGTKIISTNTDEFIPKFLYYIIMSFNLIPEGYKRHYSLIKDKKFIRPPIDEQENLTNIFSLIDSHIELVKKHILQLNNLRNSILHEMSVIEGSEKLNV